MVEITSPYKIVIHPETDTLGTLEVGMMCEQDAATFAKFVQDCSAGYEYIEVFYNVYDDFGTTNWVSLCKLVKGVRADG